MAGQRLTAEQRKILAPWAEAVAAMAAWAIDASDEELAAAKEAAEACRGDNCGWDEFRAAQALLPFIREQVTFRKCGGVAA